MTEPITRKQFDLMLADDELDLNPTARMVLYSFAMHMNYKDRVEYAYKTNVGIAAVAGISEDTAKKYRKALDDCGFLIPTGEYASVGKFNKTPIYTLGLGEPTVKLIQRHRNGNSANLDKDEATPTEQDLPKAEEEVAAPTEQDSLDQSDSDRAGERLRQNRIATPTEQDSDSDSLGAKNHKKNLLPRTSLEEPLTPDGDDEDDLPLSTEGENEVAAGGGKEETPSIEDQDEQPSSILEEDDDPSIEENEEDDPIALEGTKEATPTERESLMDYETLARQNGVVYTYLAWSRVPGVSEKTAFMKAMKQEGKL